MQYKSSKLYSYKQKKSTSKKNVIFYFNNRKFSDKYQYNLHLKRGLFYSKKQNLCIILHIVKFFAHKTIN